MWELKRFDDAQQAIAALITEVRLGATPTEREYLAEAHGLQAEIAINDGHYEQALRSLNAGLIYSSRYNDPWVRGYRNKAEISRKWIKAQQKKAGPQSFLAWRGKKRSD